LLAESKVSAWLDEDELPPGQNWISLLEKAMSNCQSAGAFVGGNGIGPWEDEEIQALLNQAVREKIPVIPVLLPGDYEQPKLPMFLANRTFVDMRQGITTELMERLIWGITGKKPQPKRIKSKDQLTVQIDRLPTVAGDFFGREPELQILNNALSNLDQPNNTRIIQFIASGGTGKTKLLRHWLNQRQDEINNYIVWSFLLTGYFRQQTSLLLAVIHRSL